MNQKRKVASCVQVCGRIFGLSQIRTNMAGTQYDRILSFKGQKSSSPEIRQDRFSVFTSDLPCNGNSETFIEDPINNGNAEKRV